MKFGQFEIIPFVEQSFKLDGGSMYGVVPKKIWSKFAPADENNMVAMDTNIFLLRAGEKNILLDTGLGDCLSPNEKKIYAASGLTTIESTLHNLGLTNDDIDIVFLSHLHTDHAGGTVKDIGGVLIPRFPKARYVVQRTEWNDAINPNERTAAVYIVERLMILQKSGQLDLLEGDTEILPNIKTIHTGGHTPGHQGIEATSDGMMVGYYADIFPSSHHIRIPYVAAVDLNPLETMAAKRKLVDKMLKGNIAIAFDHDVDIKIGRLSDENGKIIVNKVE
jgi:glyoxylase-like metal-dependent hydrolase (beta-lactamase superfamily II)